MNRLDHARDHAVGTWPGWWAAVIQLVGGTLVLLGVGLGSVFSSSRSTTPQVRAASQP